MLSNSCYDFLDLLASNKPVPGGGGASAFVGAIGMALGTMVGNLTVGKKKYAENEEEIKRLLSDSTVLTEKLEKMVGVDAEAFAPLAAAYGLPAGTDEERERKEFIMQEALVVAANAPLEITRLCLQALKILERYARVGSRIAVSDAGTGAAFCRGALQGAKLNVIINSKLIKDLSVKDKIENELEGIVKEGLELADSIYRYVEGECR